MKRTLTERVEDVRRLVEAGRVIARSSALRETLVETTRLSRQGVELALSEHLETGPSTLDLLTLCERAGNVSRVHVILSANVFVGALRALSVARAAAPRVTVTPSRREPAFAQALVLAASDPCLTIEDRLPIESLMEGEIHVYGRDATIAEVRVHAAPRVRVRGHGAGLGVACVSSRADLDAAAFALAADVVPFDQRGCLSPRIVLVQGDMRRGETLCAKLDAALTQAEERVPRGNLEPHEIQEAARYESAIAFAGRAWRDTTHLIGLAPSRAPLILAPAGRHVHVAAVGSAGEARELLAPVARFVTAVGFDDPVFGSEVVSHVVRTSTLGRMQKPALDGPVDMRP